MEKTGSRSSRNREKIKIIEIGPVQEIYEIHQAISFTKKQERKLRRVPPATTVLVFGQFAVEAKQEGAERAEGILGAGVDEKFSDEQRASGGKWKCDSDEGE